MAYLLVKYDDVNARTRPVDENNDVFGLDGIRLGGVLFDETNIGTKTEILNVQSNLTALQAAYNAHVYIQAQDLSLIRADIAALYAICQSLGIDINAIMNDLPKEVDIYVSTSGQSVFTSPDIVTFNWSEYNEVFDLIVYRNGQRLICAPSGEDYYKINGYQIQLTMDNPTYVGEKITLRVERSLLNVRFNTYFLSYVDDLFGRGVITANRYAPNTDKLMVWRNGVLLLKSATLGNPIDRYEETTSQMVTLGSLLDPSDVLTLLNRDVIPAFRVYLTGLTGTTLTIPNYTTGNKTLKVFRNGLLMNTDGAGDSIDQYSEDSTTTILLAQAATADEIFTFECRANPPTWMHVQTGFTGDTISVLPDTITDADRILVFKNGKLMYNSVSLGSSIDRYTIATSNSLTLEVDAVLTDWFAIVYNGM